MVPPTRAGLPSLMTIIKMIPHGPLTCHLILDLIKSTVEIIAHINFLSEENKLK